jgi:hypothetical protein
LLCWLERNYKIQDMIRVIFCPAGDMQFDIDGYNDTFTLLIFRLKIHEFNGAVNEQKSAIGCSWWCLYCNWGVFTDPKQSVEKEWKVPDFFYKLYWRTIMGTIKWLFLVPNEPKQKLLNNFSGQYWKLSELIFSQTRYSRNSLEKVVIINLGLLISN